MAPTTIFLTGATGYIGGAVLALLLEAPNDKLYKIAALVRSHQKAPLLEALGVRPVLGSLADLELLEKEARENDATIHTANADDLPAIQAILKGLIAGGESGGKKKVLIHTSGTGVLTDDAQGNSCYETVYDDADTAQINTLPPSQIHRPVDLAIRDASDKVNAHIILPAVIYGMASHKLVKAGISNAHSILVPILTRICISRGQAGHVGLGINRWPNIHISEQASMYLLVLTSALSGSLVSDKSGSYFFGESGEHVFTDISRAVGKALAANGIGDSEPTEFTQEDINTFFGGSRFLGCNSRAKATRARTLLGWRPQMSTKDFLDGIGEEVEVILRREGRKEPKDVAFQI